jgi:putative ABC transport system permease protein
MKAVWAIVWLNLKNLPSRWGSSSVIVVGIAGVVAVLVSILAMAQGFQKTLASTGQPDRVIVLRGGAQAELSSGIARDDAQTLVDSVGIARQNGLPLASPEALVIVNLEKRSNGGRSNVSLRGVGAMGLSLRPELKIEQGRAFRAGVREVIVGKAILQQFKVQLGQQLRFREADWTVVGVFSTAGDVHESELWADNETVLQAYKRNGFSSVFLKLNDVNGFEALKTTLSQNPTLDVSIQREPDYYAAQSKGLSTLINSLGYTVAVIMAIGALFGALNALYTAVSVRQLEIATLRALGFGGWGVMWSVLIEALLLSGVGGMIGAGLAWLFFNGFSVSTLNFQTFSQVAFTFDISPALMLKGVIGAMLLGLLGGVFPALKAARLPIVEALRGG